MLSLLPGAACSLLLSEQVVRHPQHLTVMNVVWPVSALFGTVAGRPSPGLDEPVPL